MQEVRPGIWRHFKGNEYRVLFPAIHSETCEDYVVYQALYGERKYWVRPASMWLEEVSRDGRTFPRFEYLREDSEETPGPVFSALSSAPSNMPTSSVDSDGSTIMAAYRTLLEEQDQLSQQLEAMRKQGQVKSYQFKELAARKLTNSNVINFFEKSLEEV